MPNRIGRPMKYKGIIQALDDQRVYTPAAIATLAEERGLIDRQKPARVRLRHALARFTVNHHFPHAGDGYITLKGQAPSLGWFGWRFKDAIVD